MTDLFAIASEVLEPLGFEVLEAKHRHGTLLVKIDRLDEQPVSVDDIVLASRVFGLELDRLDPIPGEYKLDLESPGPKRPLFKPRHFERMSGLKIKIKHNGQTIVAKIVNVQGEKIEVENENGKFIFDIKEIQANLAEWPKEHR